MEGLTRKVNRAVEDAMEREWKFSVERIGAKFDERPIDAEDDGAGDGRSRGVGAESSSVGPVAASLQLAPADTSLRGSATLADW